MPYMTPGRRTELDAFPRLPRGPGDLNYLLTTTLVDYITDNGLSYGTINDVLGALEGAKQEFYRRVAVPYEDSKRTVNGDVYLAW
jgi:hypothetical protein